MAAKQQRVELAGNLIVPGIGTVYHHHDLMRREFAVYDVAPNQIEPEIARVHQALERGHQELDELRAAVHDQVGPSQAEIFSGETLRERAMAVDRSRIKSRMADSRTCVLKLSFS